MKCFTTDISEEELKYVLYCLGCDLKKIKRFGAINKPIPIRLLVISKSHTASEIYEISNLFYLSLLVETYRKTGLS